TSSLALPAVSLLSLLLPSTALFRPRGPRRSLRRVQSGEEIDRPLRGRRGRQSQYPASLPASQRSQFSCAVVTSAGGPVRASDLRDRKSTRLNSSHQNIA